jgi:hypothetical protein
MASAKTKPVPKYEYKDLPVSSIESKDHLYEVKLVLIRRPGLDLQSVLNHVMSACLQHPQPIAVVHGHGASVRNLTLKRAGAGSPSEQVEVGFVNQGVPRGAKATVGCLFPKKKPGGSKKA